MGVVGATYDAGESRSTPYVALAGVLVFLAFRWVLETVLPLPVAVYESGWMLGSAVMTAPADAAAILALPLLLGVRGWGWHWTDLLGGSTVAPVVRTATVVLAWAFSLYPANFVYGHWHTADRVLVVALAGVAFFRPAAAPLSVVWSMVVAAQFEHPLPGYTWTDKRLVFDVVLVFGSALTIGMFRRRPQLDVRIALPSMLALAASWYVAAGAAKVARGWAPGDDLGNLVAASASNDWLSFLPDSRVLQLADWMSSVSPVLTVGTVAVELFAVFVLWSRRVARVALAVQIGLHLVVLASSGIFFWKWILLDAAMFVAIGRTGSEGFEATVPRRALGAAAVVALTIAYVPVRLAWDDTSVTDVYRIEAVTADGAIHRIVPHSLAPYDVIAAQGRFWFASSEEFLVDTYGSTSDEALATALEDANTPADVEQALESFGRARFAAVAAAQLDSLVAAFARRCPEASGTVPGFGWLSPPEHILTGGGGEWPTGPVVRFQLRLTRTLYDGEDVHLVSSKVVRSIRLPLDLA